MSAAGVQADAQSLSEVLSVSISANHCFINVSCKSDSINPFSNSKMICNQINLFSNCIVLLFIDFDRSIHPVQVVVKSILIIHANNELKYMFKLE